MIDMVVGQQNGGEITGGKTFGQIGQAPVDQNAVASGIEQGTAGASAQTGICSRGLAGVTLAAVNRHLTHIAGAEKDQFHRIPQIADSGIRGLQAIGSHDSQQGIDAVLQGTIVVDM